MLSNAVKWDVLEKQLETIPEYKDVLRKDPEFQYMLRTHYTDGSVQNAPTHPVVDDPSMLSQIYSNFTSLFSNIPVGQFFDGKKTRSVALEMDFLKYLQTIPDFYNTTSKYLNLDSFKEYVWPFDSEAKKPSKETVAYMTAIMDQATHLSHYNKPHRDSPIIYVVAEHDRYIPREFYHVTPLDVYSKEQTEVRVLDTGHVLAILQHQDEFRKAIVDAFVKLGCSF